MQDSETKGPIGVIVGRFQVPELHEGHRHIIEFVAGRHREVLIILGVSAKLTDRNPLSFEVRKMMIESAYPEQRFVILPSNSLPSSYKTRSEKIDELITSAFPGREAVMYGSRDSFVHTYEGRFPKEEIATVFFGNATEIRKNIGIINSADFRSGLVYAAMNRKSQGHPTIDVAVLDSREERILLVGREAEEGKFRFPGVFLDIDKDVSYEAAAQRCVEKELPHIRVGKPRLLGSCRIDDWRYRKTHDGIMTLLVAMTHTGGEAAVGKGIDYVRWASLDGVNDILVECHKPLVMLLRA